MKTLGSTINHAAFIGAHMRIAAPLAAIALFGAALPAHAQSVQANKTWVSNAGADTGTCLVTAPCKTFGYAINQTVAGGEIHVKDSGGYGGITIYKSISIIADGVTASVGVQSYETIGIDIEAASTDTVVIHGLTIDTHESQYGIGVRMNCACHAVFDHVVIRGAASGIQLLYNDFAMVSNSLITNNTYGAEIDSGTFYISNDTITLNAYGLYGNVNSYRNNAINGNSVCDVCRANVSSVSPE